MPIFNVSGALKVVGDRATNIEVRHTGSVVSTAATYLNFSGSAIQDISLGSGGGVTITLTSGTSGGGGGGGTGNISGSGASTDNALVRWDGTGGTTVQNSSAILKDNGSLQLSGSGGTLALSASIDFLPITAPTYKEGLVFYDSGEHTLCYYNDRSAVTMNIGEELWVRVRNETGASIANGTAVYVNGVHGSGVPTVAPAIATAFSSSLVLGLTTETIANNSEGVVTVEGIVRNVDTSAFAANVRLFLSPTTAGSYSPTQPTDPNFTAEIGRVLRANANGQILVRTPRLLNFRSYWLSTANSVIRTTGSLAATGSAWFGQNLYVSGSSVLSGTATFYRGLSGSLTRLSDGTSYLIAGTNITITTNSNGSITFAATGGAGGDSYWFSPSADSVRTSGSIEVSGSALIKQNLNVTGSSILSGTTTFNNGLSGSLTRLKDGTSYLIAGTNTTITTNSNGSITIASTGGGSGGKTFTWNANGQNDYFTIASASTGFDISASFDGGRRVVSTLTINNWFANLLQAGTAGTSSVELYRRTSGGTFDLMGEVSIPYTSGNYASISGTLATSSLSSGDLLFVQFKSIMSGARDLSVEVNAS